MERVMQFLSRVYQDPGHPQKMRGYAETHLDWSIKMAALKTFLEERIIKKG